MSTSTKRWGEVVAQIEKSVELLLEPVLPNRPISPQEKYDLYEQTAIAILDSQFDDFPDGELEGFLMVFLERKRKLLI